MKIVFALFFVLFRLAIIEGTTSTTSEATTTPTSTEAKTTNNGSTAASSTSMTTTQRSGATRTTCYTAMSVTLGAAIAVIVPTYHFFH